MRCIGATTLKEYKLYIEKDKALERRFQQVFVDQPTVQDTISILRGLKEKYEIHHGVRITDTALVAAATLSDRYISERFLPDKAIDLVDEAAARLKIDLTSKPEVTRKLVSLSLLFSCCRRPTTTRLLTSWTGKSSNCKWSGCRSLVTTWRRSVWPRLTRKSVAFRDSRVNSPRSGPERRLG